MLIYILIRYSHSLAHTVYTSAAGKLIANYKYFVEQNKFAYMKRMRNGIDLLDERQTSDAAKIVPRRKGVK